MKIMIKVDRQKAILAGNENFGDQVIDIRLDEIPEHLLQELALTESSSAIIKLSEGITFKGQNTSAAMPLHQHPSLSEASTDAAIEVLEARAKARKDVMELAEITVSQALALKDEDWIKPGTLPTNFHSGSIPSVKSIAELMREGLITEAAHVVAFVATHDARIKEREEAIKTGTLKEHVETYKKQVLELEAANEQREVEKKARIEAGKEALANWAAASGSERLKLMLEMGAGDWESVATDEFCAAHAPNGYTKGHSDSGKPRKKPTLEELKELKIIRDLAASSPGILQDPDIDWVNIPEDIDDEGNHQEEQRFAEAVIRVCAPNGKSFWYSKRIG